MAKRPLSAGDIIESRCTRCRVITNHIIVAMVEDRVVRVQCNTCDGVHNYHAPSTPKPERKREPKAAAPTSRPRASRTVDPREAWLAAGGENGSGAVDYQMAGKFRTGDRVRHPIFGIGVVLGVTPGKMDVVFENGQKLLRCG